MSLKILWPTVRSPISAREMPAVLLASILVGLASGAAAGLFLKLYEAARFWPAIDGQGRFFSWGLTWPLLVALPAVGGALCGWIVHRHEPAARGTGTPELLHALHGQASPIGARYALWKTLASVFTTCSGGSAGPEAPMVTFGAGLASWTGRRFKTSEHAVRLLTAAGGGAGFAAVFDAPVAGALFAIEVLMREVSPQSVSAIGVASIAGTAAARWVMGGREFLSGAVDGAGLNSPGELVFYILMAIAAALFAKLFIETTLRVEKAFDHSVGHPVLRATAGGLLLGILGLALPQALGNSHYDLPRLFAAEAARPWAWTALLFLLFGKMVACPLTVGSGGSGGIFIPYLMMGAVLGSLSWRTAHMFFAWTAPPTVYMLAGMGAVFAAVTLAPLTAFALAIELTRAWNGALPAGVAVAGAFLVARAIEPESLDTRKLLKRGVKLRQPVIVAEDSPSLDRI